MTNTPTSTSTSTDIIDAEYVELKSTETRIVIDMHGRDKQPPKTTYVDSDPAYDDDYDDGEESSSEVAETAEEPAPAVQLRLQCQLITCVSGTQSWVTRVPLDYEIWRCGVYKRKLATYNPMNPWPAPSMDATCPEAHRRDHLDRVTHYPIFLQRQGTELEWGRPAASWTSFVKLGYTTTGDQLRQPWIANSMASKATEIMNLSALGADVTSSNARDVIAFLSAMRGENRNLAPVSVVRRCGYYEINGRPCWFLGRTWIGPMEDVDLDIENMTALKAAYGPNDKHIDFYTPGSKGAKAYAEWQEFVAPYLMHEQRGYFGRWVFGLSCLPTIAGIIGQRGFIAHMFAQSGAGKTTLALLAMSGWGAPYPGQLWQNLDSTRLGAMAKFEQHASHLPILLDELQVSDNKTRDGMIYSLCQGNGRSRVAIDGTDAGSDAKSFLAIPMMTGEEGLIGSGKKDGGGQASRVVEIDVNSAALYPEDMILAVHPFLQRKIYGFMGIEFLRRVSAATATPEQRGRFITRYNELREEMRRRLAATDKNIVPRMASVAFAEYLMLLYCWPHLAPPEAANDREVLLRWARDTAIDDAMRMYECTIASGRVDQARPLRDRALDALRTHFAGNPQLYPDLDTDEGKAQAKRGAGAQSFTGFVKTHKQNGERELIYLDNPLHNVCMTILNMPARRIMNDFADAGWIRRAGSNHCVERSCSPVLPTARYYVLPLEKLAPELARATQYSEKPAVMTWPEDVGTAVQRVESLPGVSMPASASDDTDVDENAEISWSFDPDAVDMPTSDDV